MNEESKQEYNDSFEEQFGYRPSDLVWFLATRIAYFSIKKGILQKLGKDIIPVDNRIDHEYRMMLRNIENDFVSERAKRYGSRN